MQVVRNMLPSTATTYTRHAAIFTHQHLLLIQQQLQKAFVLDVKT